VKPKRRVVPGSGTRSRRTPTVRRVKPAIVPVPREASPRSAGTTAPATFGRRAGIAPSPDAVEASPAGGNPVSLEVDLGRGLVLRNPMIAAAGSLGYGVEVVDQVDLARLGAIVTRGTTLKPGNGHAAPRVVEVPAGLLIGTGLQNPGIELVLDRYAPAWAGWPVPVILNIGGTSIGEMAEVARRVDGAPGVAGLELNLSCPDGARAGTAFGLEAARAGSLVAAVRRITELPLIAKLTPAAPDVGSIARAVEAAGADAIAAVNTMPALALAPARDRPALGAGYGGLCGPALRPIALRVVSEVAGVVDIPVIGIGGVATIDDVLDLLAVGATAVGVGVAALAEPMLPARLAGELADACRARGLASAAELVGTAQPARARPTSAHGAEYAP
jgi:dihydroorotate dehydrogenase (NAD+) catalytic subunit